KEFNVTLTALKDMQLDWPRIETPTHWITMGYDRDLNLAWNQVLQETQKYLGEQRKIPVFDATILMRTVSDCRVAQGVKTKKGIHCLTPKDTAARGIPARPTAETATLYVSHAKDTDLNKAMDSASMGMIKFLEEKRGIARLDAYGLASVA